MPAITAIRTAPDLIRTTFTAFGTFGVLQLTSRAAVGPARKVLAAELAAMDRACSRFRPDSELSRLNSAPGRCHRVSPLFAEALAVAVRAAAATDGDVDPTCGASLVRLGYDRDFGQLAGRYLRAHAGASRRRRWQQVEFDEGRLTVRVPRGVLLDLGATAKAHAADRASAAISAATGAGVLVNLGGDIAVAGQPPPGGWRVEIADAARLRDRGPVVAISVGGLATSSPAARHWQRGGTRLHHILPVTGRPASSCWAAVTAAAASCADANTATTAAVIRSAEAGLAGQPRAASPAGQLRRHGRADRGLAR